MKKYKVVMLGINENENITMNDNLSKEDAEKYKKELEERDEIHYFDIIESR